MREPTSRARGNPVKLMKNKVGRALINEDLGSMLQKFFLMISD